MIITKAWAQSEEATTDAVSPTPDAAALNTETGHVEEGGEGVFPPFDPSTYASQLLWLAITFGVFYYLMARVVLPRIANILETRRGRIAQDLDQAGRLKDDADEAIAAYEQELGEARKKAGGIARAAREKAKAEADAERRKAEDALNAKLEEAEARIGQIKESALADVGTIAEETAQAIVRQLIGTVPSDAKIASAVRDAKR